jgi:histidinol-phosphate aminotransferase
MTGHTVEASSARPVRRLHLNESPLPPLPHILEAIEAAAKTVHLYPSAGYTKLLDELSNYAGTPVNRITLANGSDEVLHTLPVIAAARNAEMIIPSPSFPTFRKVAGLHGIKPVCIPVNETGVPDVEGILQAITDKSRLVCVASPNNPTGGMLSGKELERLANAIPSHCLLHLDEAYFEFGMAANGPDALAILEECHAKWVITRSFSKAFGLAGIRLGYALSSTEELATELRGACSTFNANALAIAAGRAALKNIETMMLRVQEISKERSRLASALAELGFSPLPSAANFIAVPAASDGHKLISVLEEAGILAGSFSYRDNFSALRLTVGTSEDTDAVVHALKSFLAGNPIATSGQTGMRDAFKIQGR